MYDNLIERINRGSWQQIIAFLILWFGVYSIAWTIIEPLFFMPANSHLAIWRIAYIGGTFIICAVIFFVFIYKRKLERFGFEEGDSNISKVARRHGTGSISIIQDGYHGQVFRLFANSDQNRIDFDVKASAHKAKFLIITYKPDPDLYFYARVSVISKNYRTETGKWLRFETSRSTYQTANDDEEMGIPVNAKDDDGFLRVTINMAKTVRNAFGRHGWKLDKILQIRARGTGNLKSIILK